MASPTPRRRGAPLGNRNALKHGYYTKKFARADQNAYNDCEFTGLSEEIALLRILIRRVVELGVNTDQLSQSLSMLRGLSLAITSLHRVIKTQRLLAPEDDLIALIIRDTLNELTNRPSPAGTPPPSALHPNHDTPEDEAALDRPSSYSLDPVSDEPPAPDEP